jgi:hypothetical protein
MGLCVTTLARLKKAIDNLWKSISILNRFTLNKYKCASPALNISKQSRSPARIYLRLAECRDMHQFTFDLDHCIAFGT